ncbi:hypothetical protein C1H46_032032 [Malus baccata]|uniref:Uncharacterized protein n=1 Tax=Malus baccata TaxID=106549 RepID=A0A540L7G4_MALBA|nr:hypothetical protein C1H46_032032 [Malus baccata]
MSSWLVSNDVLELVASGAKLLYVGKTAEYHSITQKKKTMKVIRQFVTENSKKEDEGDENFQKVKFRLWS